MGVNNLRSTLQYKNVVSLNREKFMVYIVQDDRLSKKDLRVVLHLLTVLDSSSFKSVSKKNIARNLNIKKSDVENSIDNLMEYEIIEQGDDLSVKDGYRLLF